MCVLPCLSSALPLFSCSFSPSLPSPLSPASSHLSFSPLSLSVTVIMPTTAPLVKVNKCRKLGANVVLMGAVSLSVCLAGRQAGRAGGTAGGGEGGSYACMLLAAVVPSAGSDERGHGCNLEHISLSLSLSLSLSSTSARRKSTP